MRLELGYEIRSDRDFDIIIENSGEISDETLQSLNEKLQSTDMQMETTAIININRRLKLYFGDKSGYGSRVMWRGRLWSCVGLWNRCR